MRILLAHVGILAWFLAACDALADSYTITVPTGFTLIANHLEHGSNTLNEVLPNVPDGTVLLKWACTNFNTNAPFTYSNSLGGWIPSGGTLVPGEGIGISNSGPAFNVTFTGTA